LQWSRIASHLEHGLVRPRTQLLWAGAQGVKVPAIAQQVGLSALRVRKYRLQADPRPISRLPSAASAAYELSLAMKSWKRSEPVTSMRGSASSESSNLLRPGRQDSPKM
jgi:hypothetical protein